MKCEMHLELLSKMKSNPTDFTEDLKYMVKMYWNDLVPLDQAVDLGENNG